MRTISTWETTDNTGKANVVYIPLNNKYTIEYFDIDGNKYYTEEFKKADVNYVEQLANDWSIGIREIF